MLTTERSDNVSSLFTLITDMLSEVNKLDMVFLSISTSIEIWIDNYVQINKILEKKYKIKLTNLSKIKLLNYMAGFKCRKN